MGIKADELAAEIYLQWVRDEGSRVSMDREALAALAEYALTVAETFVHVVKHRKKQPSQAAIAKASKKFPTMKPPSKAKKAK